MKKNSRYTHPSQNIILELYQPIIISYFFLRKNIFLTKGQSELIVLSYSSFLK